MTCSKFSIKAALLAGGIGVSMTGFVGSQPAAAQSYNAYSCPAGTVYDTTHGCTSPYGDNSGYLPGDDYGYGYMPGYDYGYVPYGGYYRDGRHEFGHGFGHGMGASVNHGASVTVLRGSPSQGLARLGDDGFNGAMAGSISNVDHGLGYAHFGSGGFHHGIGAEGTIAHHGMGFHSIGVAHFRGDGFGHGIAGGFNRGVGFAHVHGGGGFGGGGHR